MRKLPIQIFAAILTLSVVTSSAFALMGKVAMDGDIERLKTDLRAGTLQVGKTRLKDVRQTYGDPLDISATEARVVYDYGDLRLTFDKSQVWKEWGYDGFRSPVYTDPVDDLRFDLESNEIVGDNITYSRIANSYDDPTESFPSDGDGEHSIYYWGDIKITFENIFILRSWKGSNLEPEASTAGVLGTK